MGHCERGRAEDVLERVEAGFREVLQQLSKELGSAEIREALAGASGPILELRESAFRCVVFPAPNRGVEKKALTRREREVALLVSRALTNKEIAGELGIKCPTVAAHLRRIFDKVGVDCRTALATHMLGCS